MEIAQSNKQLRSFGVTVGGILLAIAIVPFLRRGEGLRLWAVVAGGALVVPGIFMPRTLRIPYDLWMRLARVLSWINTRIILSLIFYLIFAPAAFIMRLLKYDPMRRTFVSNAETYRVLRQPRSASHMKHQF